MDPGIGIAAYFWDVVFIVAIDVDDKDLSVDELFDNRKEGSSESVIRIDCGLGVFSSTPVIPDIDVDAVVPSFTGFVVVAAVAGEKRPIQTKTVVLYTLLSTLNLVSTNNLFSSRFLNFHAINGAATDESSPPLFSERTIPGVGNLVIGTAAVTLFTAPDELAPFLTKASTPVTPLAIPTFIIPLTAAGIEPRKSTATSLVHLVLGIA